MADNTADNTIRSHEVTAADVRYRLRDAAEPWIPQHTTGRIQVTVDHLAGLVAELVNEHAAALAAELDTLEGALADAAWDIHDLTELAEHGQVGEPVGGVR